jgi:iron complex outermembrane recepter protein
MGIANSEQAPSGNIDEIAVTEQKQAERLLDVPIANTAPSSSDLAERGVRQTGDIAAVTQPA